MVEGGDSASGDLAFALANAPSHTLASKPTTDSNYSTLGTVASQPAITLTLLSPSARLSFACLRRSFRIQSLLCLALFLAAALLQFTRYVESPLSKACLHDNHHRPLSLSVLPPADRRVSHEGSVLLQALCLPHHMSCYAGACECSPENIR